MLLSTTTQNGMRMTSMEIFITLITSLFCSILFLVSSFLELIPKIFEIEGVGSFLSEKLSQDPLEKFFGVQRQRGRTNENPNAYEFLKNTQCYQVINTIWLKDITGNCRGVKRKNYDCESINISDLNQPLSKRTRHQSN